MTLALLAGTLSISAVLLSAELSGRHIKWLTTGALRSSRERIMTKQDNDDDEEEEFGAIKITHDFPIRYLETPYFKHMVNSQSSL